MKKTEQRARFINKARELRSDESDAAFDAALRRIASAKPKTSKTPKRHRPRKR